MEISAVTVKQLRDKTGAGMMECKHALREAKGDLAEAEKVLRKRGLSSAASKAGRATGEGTVTAYIHTGGKIGVLVEVNCETDFAAKSEDFQSLAHEIAMHIAAAAPRFVRRGEVAREVLADEEEIARDQAVRAGKPPQVVDKVVQGRLEKFYAETCLLEQTFVKDSERTIDQLIAERVARIGENIQVRRFVRFILGEAAATG